MNAHQVLLVVAVVLFAIAAFPYEWPHRPSLSAAGLAFFAAAFLVS